MKKITRILALLSSCFLLFSVACKKDQEQGQTKPNGIIVESSPEAEQEGMDITVSETDTAFIVDKRTDYQIVYGESEEMKEAADYLGRRLLEATGANIKLIKESDALYNANAKYIAIGCNNLFADAGLKMPTKDLGITGCYIKTQDKNVFIQSQGNFGYQNGVLLFLKYTVGYEMYSGDTVVYKKSGATLPNMEIAVKPDFELHTVSATVTAEERYGWGYMHDRDVYMYVDGNPWHNTHYYLPPDTWKATHPKWYSSNGDEPTGNPGLQLCYTAHGDAVEYMAMQDAALEKMIQVVEENPKLSTISFTVMDHTEYCNCSHCLAEYDYYGTRAGSIIKFANGLASRLNDYLAAQTNPREVTVLIFAYYQAEMAPAKLVNGEYQPIDESVRMDEHLGIYIAPILYEYNKSIYDEVNDESRENSKAWAALTDNIHVWLYDTNFHHYMYPFDSWEVSMDYYKFYHSIGADCIKTMGQYYWMSHPTGFTALKNYIHAKGQWNVNEDFGELFDDFFTNYYREASEPLKKFYYELNAWMKHLDVTYEEVSGYVYCDIDAMAEFWPKKLLERWMGYIDEAYALIEKYKTVDADLHKTLVNHVKAESLFPRFALLQTYPGTYTQNELYQMRLSFKNDATELGNKQVYEHNNFEAIFNTWGV